MLLYHRTATEAASRILHRGFTDASGTYGTEHVWLGVWFSDHPLDVNDGVVGSAMLTIELPEAAIVEYEWVEDQKRHREFLIPADLANSAGPPTLREDLG